MDGTEELVRLADLLRLGVRTALQIAEIRPADACAIGGIAERALAMADELEAIARGGTTAT